MVNFRDKAKLLVLAGGFTFLAATWYLPRTDAAEYIRQLIRKPQHTTENKPVDTTELTHEQLHAAMLEIVKTHPCDDDARIVLEASRRLRELEKHRRFIDWLENLEQLVLEGRRTIGAGIRHEQEIYPMALVHALRGWAESRGLKVVWQADVIGTTEIPVTILDKPESENDE